MVANDTLKHKGVQTFALKKKKSKKHAVSKREKQVYKFCLDPIVPIAGQPKTHPHSVSRVLKMTSNK